MQSGDVKKASDDVISKLVPIMRKYYQLSLQLGMGYTESVLDQSIDWNMLTFGLSLNIIFQENIRWFREVWLNRLTPALDSYYVSNRSEEKFEEVKRTLESIRYQLAFYGQIVTPIFSLAVIEAVGIKSGLVRSMMSDSAMLIEWVGPDDVSSCPTCRTMAENSPYHYLELKSADIYPGYNVKCCTNCRCGLIPVGRENVVSSLLDRFVDLTTMEEDLNFEDHILTSVFTRQSSEFRFLLNALPSTLKYIEYFYNVKELKFVQDWVADVARKGITEHGILLLDAKASLVTQVSQVARLLGVKTYYHFEEMVSPFNKLLEVQRLAEWKRLESQIPLKARPKIREAFLNMEKGNNYIQVSTYLESKGLLPQMQYSLKALRNIEDFISLNFTYMTTDYQYFRTLPNASQYQDLVTSVLWAPKNYAHILNSTGPRVEWKSNIKVQTVVDKISSNLDDFLPAKEKMEAMSFVKDLLEGHPQLNRKEFWEAVDSVKLSNYPSEDSMFFSDRLLKLGHLKLGEDFVELKNKAHMAGDIPRNSTRHITTGRSVPLFTHEMGHGLFEIHFLSLGKERNYEYLRMIYRGVRREALNDLGGISPELKTQINNHFRKVDTYINSGKDVPRKLVEDGYKLQSVVNEHTTWNSPFSMYTLSDLDEFFAEGFSYITSRPSVLRTLSPNLAHHFEVVIKDVILNEKIVTQAKYKEITLQLQRLREYNKGVSAND